MQSQQVEQYQAEITRLRARVAELEALPLVEQPGAGTATLSSLILDATSEMFIYYDLDLRILWANHASAQSVGLQMQDLIGRHCYEVWHQRSSPCPHCPVLRSKETGQPQEGEIVTPDGRMWALRAYPIKDQAGRVTALIEFGQDITERKRMFGALAESKQRFHTIIDTSPLAILLLRDGHYLYGNPATARWLGYAPADLVGLPVEKTVDPSQWEMVQQIIAQCMAGKPSPTLELTTIRADGSPLTVEAEAVPIQLSDGLAILVVASNITERKQAEQKLKQHEEEMAAIYDNAPLIMMVIDSDRRVQKVNGFTSAFTGRKPEEMLGLRGGEALRCIYAIDNPQGCGFGPACDSCLLRRTVADTLETGTPHHLVEASLTACVAGETREMFVLFSTSRLNLRKEPMVLVSILDVTDRKRAEQDRLEMERRLFHSQKLESLGVLAGGIAHDFNNLLAAILGNLQCALADLSPDSPARSSLDESARAARRAADLTRQLLAYSGRGRFMVGPLNLSDLVQENAQMLKTAISKTVTLVLNINPHVPMILANAGQIQQVVMNLITNAAEAMEARPGRVVLSTGVQECDAAYLDRSRLNGHPSPGRYVWLEVQDDGCGMSAETQRRLLDPFFTTKTTGRGLGMAAVSGIVRGHHGAILIDSAIGQGTTIRVLFPVAESEMSADDLVQPDEAANPPTGIGPSTDNPPMGNSAAAKKAVPASDPAQPRTVLVVDDEEMVRRTCERMVKRLGYRVLGAGDGEEALQVFHQHAQEIDVIILDLTMPRMDGVATFEALRALRGDLPIVLCSGYDQLEVARRFSGQGRVGLVQKPYELPTLQEQLRRVLAVS